MTINHHNHKGDNHKGDSHFYKSGCHLYIVILLSLLVGILSARQAWAGKPITYSIDSSRGPKTSLVHTQFNFHVVAPGVWRSSQPDEESLRRMKRYGLKTIINLRGGQRRWEEKFAEDLGITYYNFPMSSRDNPNKERIKLLLNTVRDPLNQPVLIHCQEGKDRTGLIVALYKLQFLQAKTDDVIQEMLMYGFDAKEYPHLIDFINNW